MGYRIIYGPQPPVRRPKAASNRRRAMTAAFFLLGALAVRTFWPEGTAILRETFLPGQLTATEEAFGQLVQDLRDGEAVGDAVTAFCRFVVENGEAADP